MDVPFGAEWNTGPAQVCRRLYNLVITVPWARMPGVVQSFVTRDSMGHYAPSIFLNTRS